MMYRLHVPTIDSVWLIDWPAERLNLRCYADHKIDFKLMQNTLRHILT